MKLLSGLAGIGLVAGVLLNATNGHAATCPALSEEARSLRLAEHLVGGVPSTEPTLVRRGYILEYDVERRVPRWAAWHATPAYLDTPSRKGRWKSFRADPDVAGEAKDDEYNGFLAEFDYARGHIVPYFISGGDRDGDGQDAELENQRNLPVEDIDDACTVFEINYMSNIAPQLHSNFNGSGGLWNDLETAVREEIIDKGGSLHIVAGTVFGPEDVHKVGPAKDIHVPHMYYKILVADAGVVPFLFVHKAKIGTKGCDLNAALEDCIVAIADIEALTGLDFFQGLPDDKEALLESTHGVSVWRAVLNTQ